MAAANPQLLYLVSYDVSSNPTRTKMAALLAEAGYERLQLSVFLGLLPPWANEKLWQRLTQLLRRDANAEDRLFCLPVHKKAVKNMHIIGTPPAGLDYICGDDTHSLSDLFGELCII